MKYVKPGDPLHKKILTEAEYSALALATILKWDGQSLESFASDIFALTKDKNEKLITSTDNALTAIKGLLKKGFIAQPNSDRSIYYFNPTYLFALICFSENVPEEKKKERAIQWLGNQGREFDNMAEIIGGFYRTIGENSFTPITMMKPDGESVETMPLPKEVIKEKVIATLAQKCGTFSEAGTPLPISTETTRF